MWVLICNTDATSLLTHPGQYSLGFKEENQSSADALPFEKAGFKSSIWFNQYIPQNFCTEKEKRGNLTIMDLHTYTRDLECP